MLLKEVDVGGCMLLKEVDVGGCTSLSSMHPHRKAACCSPSGKCNPRGEAAEEAATSCSELSEEERRGGHTEERSAVGGNESDSAVSSVLGGNASDSAVSSVLSSNAPSGSDSMAT